MHSRVFNLNSIDCLRSGLLINLSGFSFTGTEILGSAKLTFFIIFEKQSIKKRFCSLFPILPITSSKRVNCRIVLEENQRLAAEVRSLVRGADAIEERARYDLNMVRPGEVLFRIQRPQRVLPDSAIPADILNDPLYRPAPVPTDPKRQTKK